MIVAEGLDFTYGDKKDPVLSKLSASFSRGCLTGITGPSGRGKSTLLYVAGLLLSPSSGSLRVAGYETVHARDRDRSYLRARYMGFVFQDAMLDPARSILDNVLEGGVFSGQRHARGKPEALALLSHLGVGDRSRHRPGEISGGQAQRVALCRAMIGTPAILLADEPTGNLDSTTAQFVWKVLQDYARAGGCVVVATHDERLVALCDELVRLC